MQTIYKLKTGHITNTVFGPIEHIRIAPDEGAVEGMYNSDEWYIGPNGPVQKPKRPNNPWTEYDYEAHEWRDSRPPHEQSAALAAEAVAMRNGLLTASDWVVLPYSPIKNLEAWLVYRQALRDITEQPGFPENITWPTKPTS